MDGLLDSGRVTRPTPGCVSGNRSEARGGGGAGVGSVRRGAMGSLRRGAAGSARRGAADSPPRGATDSLRRGASDSVRQGAADSLPRGATDSPRQGAADSPLRATAGSPSRGTADSPPREATDSPRQGPADSPPRETADSPPREAADSLPRGASDSPRQEPADSPPREAADSPRRGAAGSARRDMVSPKLGKRRPPFGPSVLAEDAPPLPEAASCPAAADPDESVSRSGEGRRAAGAGSEGAAWASSGEAGGCEGRGGALGRGGKEARCASVLMHPPFPRPRAAAHCAGRCRPARGPELSRPEHTYPYEGSVIPARKSGRRRSAVRARHSTACSCANGNQSTSPGHLPGTSPYPAVILSGRLRS